MPEIRLIYYSEATREMSLLDIQEILKVARVRNKELNLCGMLCYESFWFLQVLEGEKQHVLDLYNKIAKDERHEEIVIVLNEEIQERRFEEWQMGYAGSSSHFKKALQDVGSDEFSPDEMSPQQCLDFLCSLSNYQTC